MSGSIPVALNQQFDSNGNPLAGALLYLYVVGTVAQPQIAYQDTALSLPLPWPVKADQNGRLPMFYLADGAVKVTLTDANGNIQFSYPSMLVIGPSGGGASGPSVDPTTIFSSGDIKFRPTSETLSGWVKLNGLTIGSATSGASQRANADTQSLFVYLWTTFANATANAKCPVIGGLGVSALADFNANKQITLLDWRGAGPKGLDDMGASAAGNFTGVPFSGSDTATTPAGRGGENAHTLLLAEAPKSQFSLTDPGHTHTFPVNPADNPQNTNYIQYSTNVGSVFTSAALSTNTTGVSITDHAGGGAHNNAELFTLGTWYMRL